jgi:transcriptional regulator with XRE-family HTH domain
MKNIIQRNLLKLQGRMTLRAFADKLDVGQSTLHNYLKGRIPKADFITRTCKKTGCNANWLLGLSSGKDADAEVRLAALKMSVEKQITEIQETLKDLEG